MYTQASATGCRLSARPAILWPALPVLAPWLPSPAVAAPKSDVGVLLNGDRVTGEIKSLERRRLTVSADHMGAGCIELNKIRSVQTDPYRLLERTDGPRICGQLLASDDGAQLSVRADPGGLPEVVDEAGVVSANPRAGGDFESRCDGYLSAGPGLPESGDNTSTNLAAALSLRTRIRELSLDGSANVTDDGEETTERCDLAGASRRLTAGANGCASMLGFTRNTELDLNLRALVGGGIGLALSRENYQGFDPNGSIEALPGTEFRMHGSYDSDPPGDDTPTSDHDFVTSLGYKW